MANITQKPKDPTEEALSAIQDAINISQSDPRRGTAFAEPGVAAPPLTADLFHDSRQAADWTAEAETPRRAANDDRANMGQILQTLRRRRARGPFAIATAVGLAWIAGGLAIAYLSRAEIEAVFATPHVGIAAMVGLVSALVIPVVFFYVLAGMLSRTQDMRLVAESMAEMAMRLAQPETAAHESVVTVGQAIRREVAAMGDGVERALARAAELETLVHNEVSALERAYNDNEVRIRELLGELTSQRETLVSQAEQVRGAISNVHLDLAHDITSIGDLVAEKVHEVAQRVTRSLTEKGEHITLALGHAGDSMIDALGERGATLLDRLENTSDRATTAIGSASDRLSASLNFKTDHVHDEFADLATRVHQMMNARLDQAAQEFAQRTAQTVEAMAVRSQTLTQAITENSARVAETIAQRVEDVNATLRATGDSLANDLSLRGGDVVAKIEQTGSRIADTIAGRSAAMAENFDAGAGALASAMDNGGSQIKNILEARLQAFEGLFNLNGTALSEKVTRESEMLGSLITRHIAQFDDTVKTHGGALVDRLGQRTEDVATAMRTYLDTFDERVTGRTTELNATLDARLVKFEDLLGSRIAGLAKTLAEGGKEAVESLDRRIAEVSGTIDARGAAVAETLGTKIADIDRTLGAHATEVAGTLDTRIARFEELLVGRVEAVTNLVESRTKAAADALNTRTEELAQAVTVNSAEAERALRTAGDEVAKTITAKAGEIANSVSQSTAEMAAVLADKSRGVLSALDEKSKDFAKTMTSATDEAVATIEAKGFTFARALQDNGADIARIINTAGESAANSVARTMSDLSETAQQAIEKSRETSTATVAEMLETHNMLRSDATALYERLREANIMLQEVLSGSHENISALENTLMMRVSDFVTAMNGVTASTGAATERAESTIAGFRDVTANVIANLGSLAGQFDAHGRELAQAAEMIDRSNARTEESVHGRRVQLDSLVATLDIRTEDLDQRLKRFSALLDESLENASKRARDVARVVAESNVESSRAIGEQIERVREQAADVARSVLDSGAEGANAVKDQLDRMREQAAEVARLVAEGSEASTRVVSEQYERIRGHAEDERQRTAEAMQSVYRQTAAEADAIFRDAAERFASTVNGMKQMAAEMQQELETTRQELRRGVFELPHETAETTAQMRRVIVDQIEALAELNRIVARHGRGLDAAEPIRRPRDEPAFAVSSSRNEPAPFRAEAPRSELPARAPLRNDAGGFAPAARRIEPAAPPSPSAAAGRGWLSDILSRASREDSEPARDFPRETSRTPDERSPRHSIESLDSLSVDIARMIDHDAAADLWDRYKRGERNVFTRRLYTLQGQQAFDEIRKKYRGDREFKQTVDRYIGEFDRMLEEVARDDRGQVMARTYLTSETGKVYTMLAHAAGRFD